MKIVVLVVCEGKKKGTWEERQKKATHWTFFWTEGIIAMKIDNGLDATIQFADEFSDVVSLQL